MADTSEQNLRRERDFYRRQCDETGSQLLRLQVAHDRAHTEARRSRVVAALVQQAGAISETVADPRDIGDAFLEVVLQSTWYDQAAIFRHDPANGTFTLLHALGFDRPPTLPAVVSPPAALFVNSGTSLPEGGDALREGLGVPYFLWVLDPVSRHVLVTGNQFELGSAGVFEEGDLDVVGAALSVYCDTVRRKVIEQALHAANTLLERRVEERTQALRAEIGERIQAQKALAASEARLRGAVESFQEGFALFDADDRLVLANAAYRRLFPAAETGVRDGVTFETLLRAAVEQGLIRQAIGREEDFIRDRLSQHRQPRDTFLREMADGRKYLIRESRTPEGGIALAFTDFTDLNQAEEKSRRLQTELAHVSRLNTLGEMAAGFAHEVNQPLAAINSYARGCIRRLQKGGIEASELLPALLRISEQAERAGEINRRIRRFLLKEELDRAPIDVNYAIDSALLLLGNLAHERGVTVALDLDQTLPPVMADALHIQQVILNLTRNGIEAIGGKQEEPRRVTIRTTAAGTGVVKVEIEDTGQGIPPDVGTRLFEPFFTTKEGGMGIGLLVCQRIVEAHDGELSIHSDGKCGATAAFTLPCLEETPGETP